MIHNRWKRNKIYLKVIINCTTLIIKNKNYFHNLTKIVKLSFAEWILVRWITIVHNYLTWFATNTGSRLLHTSFTSEDHFAMRTPVTITSSVTYKGQLPYPYMILEFKEHIYLQGHVFIWQYVGVARDSELSFTWSKQKVRLNTTYVHMQIYKGERKTRCQD